MRKLILCCGLFSIGCLDSGGLKYQPATESAVFVESSYPTDALRSPDDTEKACEVKGIGTAYNCRVDIPYPGITDDMYLFIGKYTDGIMGGDAKHYDWYRVVGQDTVVFINCRFALDNYNIGVTYGCLP